MPPTKEFACRNPDCFLDMFESHYTYDMPDEHGPADVVCPVCTRSDGITLLTD